jgi:hypothetical protein
MCTVLLPPGFNPNAVKNISNIKIYQNLNSNRRVGQEYKKRISIKVSLFFVAVMQSEKSLA